MGWEPDDESDDVMDGFAEETNGAVDTEGTTHLTTVEAPPPIEAAARVERGLRVRPLSPSMAARPGVVSVLVTTTTGQVLYHRGVTQ